MKNPAPKVTFSRKHIKHNFKNKKNIHFSEKQKPAGIPLSFGEGGQGAGPGPRLNSRGQVAGPGPNVNGRGQGAGPGPNVNGRGQGAGPGPGPRLNKIYIYIYIYISVAILAQAILAQAILAQAGLPSGWVNISVDILVQNFFLARRIDCARLETDDRPRYYIFILCWTQYILSVLSPHC